MHRLKKAAYTVSILLLVGIIFAAPVKSNAQGNGSDDTEPISDVYLNDYSEFTSTGIQIDGIGPGTIDYNIPTADADEDHTITVTEVGTNIVTFTLSAHPSVMAATLQIGETKQYDVNDDKSNDIELTLRSVEDELANMTFKQVVASKIAQAVPLTSAASSASGNTTGRTDAVPGSTTADTAGSAITTVSATKQQLKSVLAAPWQVYLAVGLTVGVAIALYYRWHHQKLVKSLFETHWPNNDPDLR